MIFKRIRFKNFLSFGNSWTTFKLNSNETILITGANGSGKSSLLESIFFAFTGKSYRNITKPKLINNKNKKNLLVELDIEHSGKKFKIRRGLKPNIFEIIKDGVLIDEDSSIRDYQKQLETILGIDHKTFKQTIMMSSRHYIPFLELRPSEKREFIEQIFSLKLFSDMNEFLKRKIQNTKQNIKGLDKDIYHALQNLKVLNDINSKQMSNNKFQKQGLTDAIEKLKKENTEYNNKIENNKQEIDELYIKKEKIREKIKYKEKISKKFDLIEFQIESFRKQIHFLEENDLCKSCGQWIHLDFKTTEIEKIDSKIKNKNIKLTELQECLEKIKKLDKNLNSVVHSINKIRQEIMVFTSQQDGNDINISDKKELINNIDNTDLINKDEFFNINNTLIKLRKDKKHLEVFIKYTRITVEMISEKGIKKFIISKYVPILNTLLNKYLKNFEAPYSVMFDEELNENIIARGYEDLGYSNLSAGEKQRLDTSLVFSFLELCRLKNSVNTNLIILDEILDQSLDSTGVNGILKIFEEMKSQNYTILVVSHRPGSEEDFDKVYEVTKKKFSEIEEK